MPVLRSIQRAASAHPGRAVGVLAVFLLGIGGGIAAVAVSGDDESAGTTTVTTAPPTTTEPPPTTTEAPDTSTPTTTGVTTTTSDEQQRCVVWLHGKSEDGAGTYEEDGVRYVSPSGNDELDRGRQWIYFPEDEYEDTVDIVAEAIEDEGCERVIIDGFSNGGAFAAKLYCRGETFGDTVIGVVVDDPVVDTAVEDCDPASGVDVTLYWTGALEYVGTGYECSDNGWTCEGDTTIGLEAYEDELGTRAKASPFDEHLQYRDAPELADW